ncbi:hypothetical protein HYV74_01475 [Candidatus Uhrbacteria bacterium]|nr:hypothetical protein [Candidatus Uhrbacteria bacterium]
MRANGFWQRGEFRLVRLSRYDNSRAMREWFPPTAGRGIWAWAVKLCDLPEFHHIYRDQSRQIVHPRRDARAWAIRWTELDAYVCGLSEHHPECAEFDPSLHHVQIVDRMQPCWCGCDRTDGPFRYVTNSWAIYVEGPMRRRRCLPTHHP